MIPVTSNQRGRSAATWSDRYIWSQIGQAPTPATGAPSVWRASRAPALDRRAGRPPPFCPVSRPRLFPREGEKRRPQRARGRESQGPGGDGGSPPPPPRGARGLFPPI